MLTLDKIIYHFEVLNFLLASALVHKVDKQKSRRGAKTNFVHDVLRALRIKVEESASHPTFCFEFEAEVLKVIWLVVGCWLVVC